MPATDQSHSPPVARGLDAELVDELRGRISHAIDKGPLRSIQIAVARDGQLALSETFGEADNATRFNVYSCTKPVVASAVWKLMGQGAIDVERPVSDYFPEFSGGGKERVTVEQVMCHTAGFPQAPMGPPQWWQRDDRIEQMRKWHLDWEPGNQFAYHPTSAHWVLAELIERCANMDYRQYVNSEILQPLGLNALRLGVPLEEQSDIATLEHVGEPPTAEELKKLFGSAVEWPDIVDDSLLVFNEPRARALGVPGGGAVSNAADMAMFYQALMDNRNGLWEQDLLADAIGRVRVDYPDPMTGVPANRGLGVVIAGSGPEAGYRGMGQSVSAAAFGHQGVGGQIAWGDPGTGVSFCLLTNGLDVNPIRSARFSAGVNNRAGACGGAAAEE